MGSLKGARNQKVCQHRGYHTDGDAPLSTTLRCAGSRRVSAGALFADSNLGKAHVDMSRRRPSMVVKARGVRAVPGRLRSTLRSSDDTTTELPLRCRSPSPLPTSITKSRGMACNIRLIHLALKSHHRGPEKTPAPRDFTACPGRRSEACGDGKMIARPRSRRSLRGAGREHASRSPGLKPTGGEAIMDSIASWSRPSRSATRD